MAGLLAIIIFVLFLASKGSSVFFALIIGLNIRGSILNILFIALFFRHRVLKFIDLFLSRQACKLSKFVSFSLSILKCVRGGVALGDGGGYLSGEEQSRDDLGGGVGRAVTIKDSVKDLSKLTLFLIADGGYLSEVEVHGEDGRGGRGGAEDRDGGGVLVGDGGGDGGDDVILGDGGG